MFTMNTDFVRGVATWKPVTDKGGKSLPVLGAVIFTADSAGMVYATATDKVRLVYAAIPGSAPLTDSFAVGHGVFARFAAATKSVHGGDTVTATVTDGVFTLEGGGVTLTEPIISGNIPKVGGLVGDWQADDTVCGDMVFDMELLSGVVKLGNPYEAQVPAARRNNKWVVRRSAARGERVQGSVRFDRGNPLVFGVIMQPANGLGDK